VLSIKTEPEKHTENMIYQDLGILPARRTGSAGRRRSRQDVFASGIPDTGFGIFSRVTAGKTGGIPSRRFAEKKADPDCSAAAREGP
jgi:hypothetical protein